MSDESSPSYASPELRSTFAIRASKVPVPSKRRHSPAACESNRATLMVPERSVVRDLIGVRIGRRAVAIRIVSQGKLQQRSDVTTVDTYPIFFLSFRERHRRGRLGHIPMGIGPVGEINVPCFVQYPLPFRVIAEFPGQGARTHDDLAMGVVEHNDRGQGVR